MAKHTDDRRTLELPLPDKPKAKGGRPPIGMSAMTPAERKRRSRLLNRAKTIDINAETLAFLRTEAERFGLSMDQYIRAAGYALRVAEEARLRPHLQTAN